MKAAGVAGTSWGVDPVADRLLISADSTVTGVKLAKVRAVAERFGAAARRTSAPSPATAAAPCSTGVRRSA
ncbi:alpha-lytic protease prodomain-containing protein [Actinomadura sp. DC4]|uniref:alpha-lytic protease prodomain-containing protein n=1 Tax=Actinomadura sp. DC4 TaxID=3055069 RepID=UPI0025B033F6|nr:alpha-lytic protease prodomain-containing protein [Actinomadura sp. DC4]MDN3354682.1 alpha-lytic protease prodomain-containing protein [Actinomadura sp. DC4]